MTIAMHHYEAIRLALAGAGVSDDSAELHGGVCASLCVGGIAAAEAWADVWLSESEDSAAAREMVEELGQESWGSMSAGDFTLELILPDEDTELGERVGALARWCHGFVSGLGVAGLTLSEYGADIRTELEEIIRDFGEISRASTDVEDVVEGGFQLASILEFVRAGVQIVFESLAEQRTMRISGRLH